MIAPTTRYLLCVIIRTLYYSYTWLLSKGDVCSHDKKIHPVSIFLLIRCFFDAYGVWGTRSATDKLGSNIMTYPSISATGPYFSLF